MEADLEKISVNGDTCRDKFFAMRSAYVPEEKVKCRNCFDNYQEKCPEYVPASRTSIPIRKGYFACSNGVRV
jgi:hypothetical protein